MACGSVGPYEPCPCGSGAKFKFCCGKAGGKVPPASSTSTIHQALALHTSGQFAKAEELYRQVLSRQPRNADALHLLGVLHHQTGRNKEAIDLIRNALAVNPDWPDAMNNLAVALRADGDLDAAVETSRQSIALKPANADAHNNLGNALREKGAVDEAIQAFRRALSFNEKNAEAWCNLAMALDSKAEWEECILACRKSLSIRRNIPQVHFTYGNALHAGGEFSEAVAAYREAIALVPNYAEAHSNLGNTLLARGAFDEAVAAIRLAIEMKPNFAQAFNNLGNALAAKRQWQDAISAYEEAIRLCPDDADAMGNLGRVLAMLARFDEAISICKKAVMVNSANAISHLNLGNVHKDAGLHHQAIASYRQAIAIDPHYAIAHNNLALSLLMRGDWTEAWEEHEWRWKSAGFNSPRRKLHGSPWEGERIEGRTLLVYAEQGLGDTIQFIRYLPMVRERVPRVVVECQSPLLRLLRQSFPDVQVISFDDPEPAYDMHCPLMSLPFLMGTTVDTIPNHVPYLKADAEAAEQRRIKIRSTEGLHVGIVWAGNRQHGNDMNRSMALNLFAPLADVRGVTFHSLQKGDAVAEAKEYAGKLAIIDQTSALNDFADTGALISSLDLVISVDTSVVHLAGALGKPVWIMLPYVPDWRWLLERSDSPWYPTARLFRQTQPRDWATVVERVKAALATLASASG